MCTPVQTLKTVSGWHLMDCYRDTSLWEEKSNNKKKVERTGTFQPSYYAGGPILDVHHSHTMFLLANVQNEDVHSSCTPYCALPVYRFCVCNPYNFDKCRDSGHIILPRPRNNRLKYSRSIITQWNEFNSESVYLPWFWKALRLLGCTLRVYAPMNRISY